MKATLYKIKEGYVLCKHKSEFESLLLDNVLSESPDFSLLSEEDAKRIGCVYNSFISELLYYVPYSLKDEYKQKHAELTSDRMFTEDDIRKAFHCGCLCKEGNLKKDYEELIKSLSQPKSWEVEYKEENGVYKVLSVS